MVDRVSHLESVLRDTIRSPPPAMPLRRHHDDDYWDRVTVTCPSGISLVGRVEPRFKTSGISGSEWRVRAMLQVRLRPDGPVDVGQRYESPMLLERGYGRMRGLLEYAPYHVYAAVRASPFKRTRALLETPQAILTVERKGVVLMREERPTFGDAVLGMGWHAVSANEGREGVEWHHLSTEEELAHCQQVGCANTPRNFYRLKKLQAHKPDVMVEPEYDFTGQFAWYCGRHTVRGSQSSEDNDDNLELVMGPGTADTEPDDESPAALRVMHV